MSGEKMHIGIVAAGKREILPGHEFNSLFPKPDHKKTIVDRNGTVEDTMVQIGRVLGNYHKDTAKLAPIMKGKSLEQTCRNIFDFVYNHIQYELDEPGEEQLRRPARAWADRVSGVDCDCYSIFISSILMNLGINFKLRITKYDGKGYYQHVYVIVPYNGGHYVIDPVLDTFNFEKQFSGNKDFTMEQLGIPIAVLHGFEGAAETNILDDLLNGGLGDNLDNEQAIYQHLLSTKKTIESNPGIINSVEYTPGFMKMLDYAIENFNKGPKARAKAFEILAQNEAQINKKLGITDDDLNGFNDEEDDDFLMGFSETDDTILIDDDDVYPFSGNGEVDTDLSGKAERKARKAKRKEKRAEKKADKKEKKAAKKAERKEEKAGRKAERKNAKGFFRKIGVSLKQGGRAFVKYNPVVIAGRNGFLVSLRTNMFKMSSRLKWGYATDAQAKAAGISPKRHAASKKALKNVEEMFDQKLQGSKVSLKRAILSGKHNLSGVDDTYEDFSGLGFVEEGMVAAALPIIYGVVRIIQKDMDEVDHEEGARNMFKDAGLDPSDSESSGKTKMGKIIASIFKKKDTQKAIKDVESEFGDENDPGPDDDDPPKDDFFTQVKSFVVANPILTVGVAAGLSYILIPGVRNGVNNLFKGKSKPAAPKQATQESVSGLNGSKEVKSIKFK